MKLILIRHGQTLGNVDARIQGHDDPLTDLGLQQARITAKLLGTRGDITHLYASPLDRAFETARIIGAALGLEPVPVAGLAEVNAGDATGMLWTDWTERFPEQAAIIRSQGRSLHHRWVGGESGQEVADRVLAAYDEIVTRHQGGDDVVAAVSHGGPLAWISARLHGDPMDAWPSRRGIFGNCSISELDVDARGHGEIVSWNQTGHLDGIAPSGDG
ncbi:MAG: histidine phosphatase family protein [Chloroflexia bacterium]|nr:histidine phosphatase family protein [Chloroflexia bacterium]